MKARKFISIILFIFPIGGYQSQPGPLAEEVSDISSSEKSSEHHVSQESYELFKLPFKKIPAVVKEAVLNIDQETKVKLQEELGVSSHSSKSNSAASVYSKRLVFRMTPD